MERDTSPANGNVTELVNTNGASVAHYEYDPYGNLVIAEGSAAQDNPFLFSTKYLDQETGWYYYGYRYYSPELGRWTRRDPIWEEGFAIVFKLERHRGRLDFGDYFCSAVRSRMPSSYEDEQGCMTCAIEIEALLSKDLMRDQQFPRQNTPPMRSYSTIRSTVQILRA